VTTKPGTVRNLVYRTYFLNYLYVFSLLLLRSSAYAVLRAFTHWRVDVAVRLFLCLQVTHNNFPPIHSFSFKPEKDAISPMGYVGIRNMGCTCYMNSLLQVLYTIPSIREGILSARTQQQLSGEAQRDDILLQLKKIFLHLKYSESKSFSPDDWVYAYKDDTGALPINVMHQQDAQEFLQVLTNRLEQALSRGENTVSGDGVQLSQSKHQRDMLKRAFGGNLCNMMINNHPRANSEAGTQSAENTVPDSSRVREQKEGFVCISVDVKGCSGLEDSLTRFVAGETISDFIWEEHKPRVSITKHQCVSELSDTLVFHLKRFELNYDTLKREKVNDLFPFPKRLNMKPYTREYLLSTMNTAGADVYRQSNFREEEYYDYELCGVVVHTGTSDSGHYYSYIKVPDPSFAGEPSEDEHGGKHSHAYSSLARDTRKWLEFNDSEVKEFAESQLDNECFGGSTLMHEISAKVSSAYQMENQKNAYMLVYTRVKPFNAPEQHNDGNDVVTQMRPTEPDLFTSQVLSKIAADNTRMRLAQRVFAQPHLEFVVSLLQDIVSHDVCGGTFYSGKTQAVCDAQPSAAAEEPQSVERFEFLTAQILAECVMFSSLILSRCADVELFKRMNNMIRKLLNSHTIPRVPATIQFPLLCYQKDFHLQFSQPATTGKGQQLNVPVDNTENMQFVDTSELVLRKFIHMQWMENVVVKNLIMAPEAAVRMQFALLLLALLAVARTKEGDEAYGSFPLQRLKVGTMSSILNLNGTHGSNTHRSVSNTNAADILDTEDAELAMAIKLSQSESSELKNKAQATI
jgi:ubiquitin C-terminal hydrolase